MELDGFPWTGDSANEAAKAAYATLLVIRIKDYSDNLMYQQNVAAIQERALVDAEIQKYHGNFSMDYILFLF
jgi:hypothetical protein